MFHFFSAQGKLLLAAAMLLVSLFGCKKDHLAPLPEGAGHQAKPNYPISLFEAMAHFSSVQGTAPSSLTNTDFIDLDPRWSEAYLSQSQSGKEIVVVPLADTTLRALNQGRADAKLLFSKDGPDTIVAEILVYAADSAYLAGKSTGPEFGDFTGQYLFFDIGYNFKYGIWVEDGVLNGYVMTIDRENTSGVSNSREDGDPVEDCIDHVISEFITYQCDATEQVFWDCHAMIISTIAICHTLGGGGGGGGGTGGSGGTGGGGYGTGGGTGGSGNNNENPYSPFWDVFTGSLPMGIFVQSPSLLPPGFDTTLVRQFIDINRIFNFLPQQLIDLSNNPAYIQVLYNIFAPWVNVPITPENQANAPNFALVKPVTDFAIKHKLTAQQFEALLRDGALFGQVKAVQEALLLSNAEVGWLTTNPLHAGDLDTFLDKYGAEEGAKEHANTHLDNLMTDPEYREMSEASFDWPEVVWTIAQELIGDALIDLILNQIPLFNNQDEIRDIIKSAKNGSWLEFSYEVSKLVFKVVLKNNPYANAVQVLWEGSEKAAKIGKTLGIIKTLLGTMSTQAVERAWGILEKMGGKLFDFEDLSKYLKYIDDLKTPKLGGYFATKSTYNANFKNKFSDVSDQIGEVHHAVPRWVQTRYAHLGITNNQLHSLENLRGIPNNNSLDHTTITNYWEAFYNSNQNANLGEVMDFVKFIDDEFGHLFVPPVR